MIKVVRLFYDLQDGGYEYKIGDAYPRKGYKATDARIAELAGNNNKLGVAVIKVEETKEQSPKKNAKNEK